MSRNISFEEEYCNRLHSESINIRLVFITLLCLIPFIITSNFLYAYATLKSTRRARFKSSTKLFLAKSVVDMLVGGLLLPCEVIIVYKNDMCESSDKEVRIYFALWPLLTTSLILSSAIAVMRYLRISNFTNKPMIVISFTVCIAYMMSTISYNTILLLEYSPIRVFSLTYHICHNAVLLQMTVVNVLLCRSLKSQERKKWSFVRYEII